MTVSGSAPNAAVPIPSAPSESASTAGLTDASVGGPTDVVGSSTTVDAAAVVVEGPVDVLVVDAAGAAVVAGTVVVGSDAGCVVGASAAPGPSDPHAPRSSENAVKETRTRRVMRRPSGGAQSLNLGCRTANRGASARRRRSR